MWFLSPSVLHSLWLENWSINQVQSLQLKYKVINYDEIKTQFNSFYKDNNFC